MKERDDKEHTRELVVCVWCGWRGRSPVKRKLVRPGMDYPVECRQCHAIGLRPVNEEPGICMGIDVGKGDEAAWCITKRDAKTGVITTVESGRGKQHDRRKTKK